MTWPLKLVKSMEYTDAWFIQQVVRPIEGSILDFIAADTNYNIYSHIYG